MVEPLEFAHRLIGFAFPECIRDSHKLGRRAVLIDALLYAAAAAFAVHSVRSSQLVAYRTWAAFAWPAYTMGALVAIILCFAGASMALRRLAAIRAALAATVLIAAVGAPLAAVVKWRAERGPHYAPSEVILTETAAHELVHGRNPYSTRYGSPELAGRDPSVAGHFPYLPGMAVFGLPRVTWPDTPWTDARMGLAVMIGVVAAVALVRWRAPPGNRLRALQVLVILPTGAPLVVTGSGDIAVLALCLLALVLLHERRRTASVLTAAVAASLKFTAWPVLLAIAMAVSGVRGVRDARLAVTLGCALVGFLVVAGFVAGATSFATDVILFPLGLTSPPTPANSDTLGSLVLTSVDGLPPLSPTRLLLIGVLLGTGVCLGAAVLALALRARRRGTPLAAAAAVGAGGVVTALILLAPTGRSGYFVYPLELAVWAALLRTDNEPSATDIDYGT